ncbi:MAG: hypothetical protein JWL97_4247, partial [Gemmatimonadales bacterium]|nr:hypothetical protein [Gemmatimonadales bacterium]
DVARAAAVYATNHAAQTGDPSGALMFMGGVEAS